MLIDLCVTAPLLALDPYERLNVLVQCSVHMFLIPLAADLILRGVSLITKVVCSSINQDESSMSDYSTGFTSCDGDSTGFVRRLFRSIQIIIFRLILLSPRNLNNSQDTSMRYLWDRRVFLSFFTSLAHAVNAVFKQRCSCPSRGSYVKLS